MARIQLATPVSEISGSIGGVTFQRNRSGIIARKRPFGRKFPTPNRSTQENSFAGLQARWNGLSNAEKITWNDFADLHDRDDYYGNPHTITGCNWHNSINFNREQLGLLLYDDAPAYITPSAVLNYNVLISAAGINLSFFQVPANTFDTYKLFATLPTTRFSPSIQSELRFIGLVPADVAQVYSITSLWEAYFGLDVSTLYTDAPFDIGVMLVPIRESTGIGSTGLIRFTNQTAAASGIGSMIIGSTFIVS